MVILNRQQLRPLLQILLMMRSLESVQKVQEVTKLRHYTQCNKRHTAVVDIDNVYVVNIIGMYVHAGFKFYAVEYV